MLNLRGGRFSLGLNCRGDRRRNRLKRRHAPGPFFLYKVRSFLVLVRDGVGLSCPRAFRAVAIGRSLVGKSRQLAFHKSVIVIISWRNLRSIPIKTTSAGKTHLTEIVDSKIIKPDANLKKKHLEEYPIDKQKEHPVLL